MIKPKQRVIVTEYDYLVCGNQGQNAISQRAFDELTILIEETPDNDGIDHGSIFWQRGKKLSIRHYVGVIQTSDGTQIEILPKIAQRGVTYEGSRNILLRMLREVGKIPYKSGQHADLAADQFPLLEIFLCDFLIEVDQLVKRGIRSDYVRQTDNLPFLKGKLLIKEQLKHNLICQHRFYVEFDSFEANRPENRLLKSALQKVLKLAREYANQRLARELLFVFEDIPFSNNYPQDFQACSKDRGMQYYQSSLEWCRLILNNESPVPHAGDRRFHSFLFPMPRLFEEYLTCILQRYQNIWQVSRQVRTKNLLRLSKGSDWFYLKPDILLKRNDQIIIVDAKWKLLDIKDKKNKFGVYQADLYQLFTYAKYYQAKRVILAYPKTEDFNEPLNFEYIDQDCSLNLLPLDLSQSHIDSVNHFVEFLNRLDQTNRPL